jgi:integrase
MLYSVAPSGHVCSLTAGRIFFNWCQKRRYITHNPCDGLSKHQTTPRSRLLSDEELATVWKCTTGSLATTGKLPPTFARIVQLLILTGLRRGECAHIRSDHVKNGLLILPANLTKNGREHLLPVSDWLLQILQPKVNGYLFSTTRGVFNGWSKAKKTLDEISGVTGWTLHDIRRTVAARMAEMGVAPHVIERIVNHVSGQISGIAAVYNRARYLEEMGQAIALWESKLTALLHLSQAA